MDWHNIEVLITGGTGSLGNELVKQLHGKVRGIRIYSRDEKKQWDMRRLLERTNQISNVSFLIGDVRNRERLRLAMQGVHLVIHTAAMKQVPACEYNPWEAVSTNIVGAWNVIHASLETRSVRKVMNISTDKAVYPVNLYGVTKAAAEKLFIHSNIYSRGGTHPYFSCCRYGNVIGSRGSILPLFLEQLSTGILTITHKDMTRFWITLHDVAAFVLKRLEDMIGGEIFIPKMPSIRIMDVAKNLANAFPDRKVKISEIGIRQGEKIHECLITGEEVVKDMGTYFVIPKENNQIDRATSPYMSNHTILGFLSSNEIVSIIQNYILCNKK